MRQIKKRKKKKKEKAREKYFLNEKGKHTAQVCPVTKIYVLVLFVSLPFSSFPLAPSQCHCVCECDLVNVHKAKAWIFFQF